MDGNALWSTALAAFIGSLAGATFGAMIVAVVVVLYNRPPRRRDRTNDER